MFMLFPRSDPVLNARRLWLIAAVATLAGCTPAEPEDNVANQQNASEVSVLPSVPLPQPPMDRAALLRAIAAAASAAATGADDTEVQRQLDGDRFELRIRFGCRGPVRELRNAVLGWTFDREDRTLRVRAMPTISAKDDLVAQVAGDAYEAVEGFWVPRPWVLDPLCPSAAAVRPAPPPSATESDEEPSAGAGDAAEIPAEDQQETRSPPPAFPKVGLAQFFTENEPRSRRRSMRPYQTVETLAEDRQIGSQGFNLVLSGRLKALADQRVIACVARGADAPPDCIVSADFDRVWMEWPDSEEKLAEWGSG